MAVSEIEVQLFDLPARAGGLGILDPMESAFLAFSSSLRSFAVLRATISGQAKFSPTVHVHSCDTVCHEGSAVQEISVVMSVGCLSAYAPQDIRDHQLADSLIGSLLMAKEANEKPQFGTGDPRWCKLVQL